MNPFEVFMVVVLLIVCASFLYLAWVDRQITKRIQKLTKELPECNRR